MKNYAVILASGVGSRYGQELPKQFVVVAGKTILEHTLDIFQQANNIHRNLKELEIKMSKTRVKNLIYGRLRKNFKVLKV